MRFIVWYVIVMAYLFAAAGVLVTIITVIETITAIVKGD